MAKFRFEFEDDDFVKGDCAQCPLSYWDEHLEEHCVVPILFGKGDEIYCPLEEVEE